MTSKELNKQIKALTEEKENLLLKEMKASTFRCSVGEDEDKIRPEYDFKRTECEVRRIDIEIMRIKHRLNVFNTNTIVLNGMTIDEVLVRIPQLSLRKATLKDMANRLKRERVEQSYGNTIVDYTVINYDIDDVKEEYEKVSKELNELQIALDDINNSRDV